MSTTSVSVTATASTPAVPATSPSLDWDRQEQVTIILPRDRQHATAIRLIDTASRPNTGQADLLYRHSPTGGSPELVWIPSSGVVVSDDTTTTTLSIPDCQRALNKAPIKPPFRRLRLGVVLCIQTRTPPAMAALALTQPPDQTGTLHGILFYRSQPRATATSTPTAP